MSLKGPRGDNRTTASPECERALQGSDKPVTVSLANVAKLSHAQMANIK